MINRKSISAIAATVVLAQTPAVFAADIGVGAAFLASEGGTTTITIPVRTSALLIEPDFQFTDSKSDRTDKLTGAAINDSAQDGFGLGVGVYMRKSMTDALGMYFGGRIGLFEYNTVNSAGVNKSENDNSGYTITPTFGLEYSFNSAFSVGAQVGLVYQSSTYDSKSTSSGVVTSKISNESDYMYTSSQIMLRVYF